MPRGLARILSRVRSLAAQGNVRFTLKALQELAVLGLDESDACQALADLTAADFVERFTSWATGE
jgi:Motility quorum-sensing regulator, toxin of MqsA